MNGAKIYVGNLAWSTNDETLRQVFGQYGNVLDSIVMRDRESGRSRGFGFVTYATQDEASGAIATANGIDLDGRQIKVNLANARGSGGPGVPGGGMYGQAGFGNPYGGYPPAGGYAAAPGQYGGFNAYQQPPQGNAPGFPAPNFNQGPGVGGYGAPPNQFAPPNPNQGYLGGGY